LEIPERPISNIIWRAAGMHLAPALFSSVIDWAMRLMPNTSGVHVGRVAFSDLDYTDNIALLAPQHDELGQNLEDFADAINTLGLNVSWTKTNVKNLGTSDRATNITVQGQQV